MDVRRFVVALQSNEYQQLVQLARADTREPEQQALHYVRQAIQESVKQTAAGAVQ